MYPLPLRPPRLQSSFDSIYKKGQIMSSNGVQGVCVISVHIYSGEDSGLNYFSPWWRCKSQEQWKGYERQYSRKGNYSRVCLRLTGWIIFTLILIIFYFICLLCLAGDKMKPAQQTDTLKSDAFTSKGVTGRSSCSVAETVLTRLMFFCWRSHLRLQSWVSRCHTKNTYSWFNHFVE